MARFDVFRLTDGTFVLDCQSDGLMHLNTRLVVPLWPPANAPLAAARMNPVLKINGQDFVMVTQFASAVALTQLREHVATLSDSHLSILAALDFLIGG